MNEDGTATDGVDGLQGYKATHVCGDNYRLDTANQPKQALDSQALEKSAALGVEGQTSADRKSGGGNTRVV